MKKFFLIIFIFFLAQNAFANHYMGGEITWECLTAGSTPTPAPGDIGKYVFYLKTYRDCRYATPISDSLQITVHNNPSVGSFYVFLTSTAGVDITPRCVTTSPPPISCAGGEAGAAKIYTYKSDPIGLPGVPPVDGWIFTSTASPRQPNLSNIQYTGTVGMTFRAKMFKYNNLNENPCFDSSPKFLENPTIVGCTGYPFNFSDAAFDPDLDSLKYSWGEALNELSGTYTATNPTALTYTSGYSYFDPLPGNASIDGNNGEVYVNAPASGEFIIVMKVQAYKGGTLVAEVYRERQLILLSSCGLNNIPIVAPPLNGGITYADTVNAGDTISFILEGIDTDGATADQTLTITASGSQFGAGFTSTTTGCLNPPCATLNPAPGNTNITNHQSPVQTTFGWRTDCSHIDFSGSPGSLSNSSTYVFTFKVTDRFCPVPASAVHNISITVVGKPLVSPPLIRCASVLANGDVQLTWIAPVDNQGSFIEQRLYTSTSASGPFTQLPSPTGISTSSYLHTGANANNVDRYYYTSTKSGCNGTEVFSDTIKVMSLNVISAGGGGIGHLTWNPLAVPQIPTSTGIYNIWVSKASTIPPSWVQVGTSMTNVYDDIVSICSDSIIYRVSIDDNVLGCTSYSKVNGAFLGDNTPPSIPVMDVADVNGSLVDLSWNASPNGDLEKYYIYRKQLGGGPVYSLYDSSYTNTYTDVLAPINTESVYYTVAAKDSCKNISPYSLYHQTIFLETTLDLCLSEFKLKWNSYKNMPGGVTGYNIYAGVSGTPLIGTTTDTTYSITNLIENANYCMYVEAVGTGPKTARSNQVCKIADVPTKPLFLYLSTATVENDGSIRVSAVTDTAADIKKYNLFRSSDIASFELIGSLGSSNNPVVTFYDIEVEPSVRSYTYEITAIDSCDLVVMTSNVGKTIYVTAVADVELVNNDIYWSKYEDWAGGVVKYNVYRSNRDYSNPVFVNRTLPGVLKLEDDISDFITGTGEFCYYIEAVEGTPGPYPSDSSYSNIFCVTQYPGVFVPSAFNPSGVNKEFKPVMTFVDNSEYEFRVFNRWGQTVFVTNDIDKGWDGRYDGGGEAPEAVYVYYVKYKSSQGVNFEKKGTVTLIR